MTNAERQRTRTRQMEGLPLIAEGSDEGEDKAPNEEPLPDAPDAANRETKSNPSD